MLILELNPNQILFYLFFLLKIDHFIFAHSQQDFFIYRADNGDESLKQTLPTVTVRSI